MRKLNVMLSTLVTIKRCAAGANGFGFIGGSCDVRRKEIDSGTNGIINKRAE